MFSDDRIWFRDKSSAGGLDGSLIWLEKCGLIKEKFLRREREDE